MLYNFVLFILSNTQIIPRYWWNINFPKNYLVPRVTWRTIFFFKYSSKTVRAKSFIQVFVSGFSNILATAPGLLMIIDFYFLLFQCQYHYWEEKEQCWKTNWFQNSCPKYSIPSNSEWSLSTFQVSYS